MGFVSHTFLFRCADQMLCHLSTNRRTVLSTSAEPQQLTARPGGRQRCGPGPGSTQTWASQLPLSLLPASHIPVSTQSQVERSKSEAWMRFQSGKAIGITRAGARPGPPNCLWREGEQFPCISSENNAAPPPPVQHQLPRINVFL